MQRDHLLYIVTSGISVRYLLENQLLHLVKSGFRVSLIVAPDPRVKKFAEENEIGYWPIRMSREIRPASDLFALLAMIRKVRQINPDIVNFSTPKAALLGAVSSWMARVPKRVYLLRGLRLETAVGIGRFVLWTTEWLTAACSTHVVSISKSLKSEFLRRKLCSEEKIRVLGSGSSGGVDVEYYSPLFGAVCSGDSSDAQADLANSTIGFVGRLTNDKGIADLIEVLELVRKKVPNTRLLLVGGFDDGDKLPDSVKKRIVEDPLIEITGFVDDVRRFYRRMNVLAFPTSREGFGNVAIEAASMEVPVVGYEVTGVTDSVESGVTGTLVQKGRITDFASAIVRYLQCEDLQKSHGQAGRRRAIDNFRRELVWRYWDDLYRDMLSSE